jgi:hypothetical protein
MLSENVNLFQPPGVEEPPKIVNVHVQIFVSETCVNVGHTSTQSWNETKVGHRTDLHARQNINVWFYFLHKNHSSEVRTAVFYILVQTEWKKS